MDALILAGGMGTRLKSIINDRPKPLAPINSRPFIFYLLDQLISCKHISRIIISTGYRSDLIQEAIKAYSSPLPILFSKESLPLGTGGAIIEATSLITSPHFLAMNGDSYIDVDITACADEHFSLHSQATILCQEMTNSGRFGSIQFHPKTKKLLSFAEKEKQTSNYINAGIYFFNKEVFKDFPKKTCLSLEKEIFPNFSPNTVHCISRQAKFIDIGTPSSYTEAQSFFT